MISAEDDWIWRWETAWAAFDAIAEGYSTPFILDAAATVIDDQDWDQEIDEEWLETWADDLQRYENAACNYLKAIREARSKLARRTGRRYVDIFDAPTWIGQTTQGIEN
jgi:hypothetical protein